jgi:hypothetical protein
MAGTLPYVNQPGSIAKILEKIKEAKTPDRFTVDFLQTKSAFQNSLTALLYQDARLGTVGHVSDPHR